MGGKPKKKQWFEKYKVDVPEGVQGAHRVERFEITESQAAMWNVKEAFRPGARHVIPGKYTRLVRGRDTMVMSDTPSEIRDHLGPIQLARGAVLVHGLGLGVVVNACLANSDVSKVTVVEINEEVIALVAPHYEKLYGDRFELIQDNALTWKPERNRRWNIAWHDIWDTICADNLDDMKKLHRRFGRRVTWQGSWCRELCEYYRRF